MDHLTPDASGPTGRDPLSEDADRQDLKATEASIRSDLQRLTGVEREKQSLASDDPRVDELSDQAVELAERIHRQTRAERELSRAID